MDVRVGPQIRLSAKELMLSNCGAGEDSWESLGQQGDQASSQSERKSVLNIHWKDLNWSLKLQYFGHLMLRIDSSEKTLMLGKIEGRRRGNGKRWNGWVSSLTHWTWFERASGVGDGQGSLACWSPWGGKVGHAWVNELNWCCTPVIYIIVAS